ncbi:MAG TPA: hypothetical protein VIK86_05315 [Candidatus Paceibacterota bacterium]
MIQLMIPLLYVQDSGYGPTIAIFIVLGAIGFFIRWFIGEDGNRFEHHSHHEEHEPHYSPPAPVITKNYERLKIINIKKGDKYRIRIPAGFGCSYRCNLLSLDSKEGFYVGIDANQERIAVISANPIYGYIPYDDRSHTLYLSYYNKDVTVYCEIKRPPTTSSYDVSAMEFYR